MSGGITLGHVFIASAILIAVVMPLRAFLTLRGNPDATADERRAVRWVVGAALATAVGLVLIGLFLPDAQMRIA